jgi:TonB family protein
MDRLAKKCVIGSGFLHGTLLVVLLVGPAFLGSSPKTLDPSQVIDFIPLKTIDQNLSGGGNPNVPQTLPSPTPPAPKQQVVEPPQPKPPEPKPQPKPKPDPDPDPVKPTKADVAKTDPDSFEPPKKKPHKIEVNTTKVVHNPNNKTSKTTEVSDAEERAKAKADAKKRQAEFESALNNIRDGASGGVSVELRGPGGGGIPYAGFNQALISAYMRAWRIPSEAAGSSATVTVSVTLRNDGTVISSRIERHSGNSDLDGSVQRALDNVSVVAPFPSSVKDTQKTFRLEFDPKAKQAMG